MAQTIWRFHSTPAAIGTARAQVRLLVGFLFVGTVHWRPVDHRLGVFSRVLSAGGGTNGIRKILAVCATYLVCAVEQHKIKNRLNELRRRQEEGVALYYKLKASFTSL